MKLYMTNYSGQIKEVESEKQTDKSVFINGVRSAWRSTYSCFFKTFDEAKNYVINNCQSQVDTAKNRLE